VLRVRFLQRNGFIPEFPFLQRKDMSPLVGFLTFRRLKQVPVQDAEGDLTGMSPTDRLQVFFTVGRPKLHACPSLD
jgi:hypothetical protein